MARFFRRNTGSRRYMTKRNAERHIRGGATGMPAVSQTVAYTYTATEACTVKSIKLDLGITGGVEDGTDNTVAYVLVRIPEGYTANNITYPALTDDMYNPTDQVLISGVLTDAAVEDHKSNMIGRKLKAGDQIALILKNTVTHTVTIAFELNFSVLT